MYGWMLQGDLDCAEIWVELIELLFMPIRPLGLLIASNFWSQQTKVLTMPAGSVVSLVSPTKHQSIHITLGWLSNYPTLPSNRWMQAWPSSCSSFYILPAAFDFDRALATVFKCLQWLHVIEDTVKPSCLSEKLISKYVCAPCGLRELWFLLE